MPQSAMVTYNGETLTRSDLAARHGITRKLLNKRLAKGEPLEYALRPSEARPERLITVNGQTQALRKWARNRGIKISTLSMRAQRGWTELQALEFEERTSDLPDILRWIRKETLRQKLTIEKVAHRSGVPERSIRDWLRSDSDQNQDPRLKNMMYVIGSLGYSVPALNGSATICHQDVVEWMFVEAEKKGISVDRLSSQSCVSRRTLYRWRTGLTPRLKPFLRCLKALGLKFPMPVRVRQN